MKNVTDNGMLTKVMPDGKSAPMTAEEAIAAASDRVDQAMMRQRSESSTRIIELQLFTTGVGQSGGAAIVSATWTSSD